MAWRFDQDGSIGGQAEDCSLINIKSKYDPCSDLDEYIVNRRMIVVASLI